MQVVYQPLLYGDIPAPDVIRITTLVALLERQSRGYTTLVALLEKTSPIALNKVPL